ncbi:MAG: ABC transporter ATP-binding protein [Gaiellaceae bacterium MAG52_C11]|nr:ABC transporter ATP-binding protein [Candidatus Gaiellasilicea maunaloa]
MNVVVSARDVFFLYPARHGDVAALRGLTLEVHSGEAVALLGPSGSGKTTFLRLCSGEMRPSTGALSVLERSVTASSFEALRCRDIGIVHQHYHRALPPELTVEEIVELPLHLLGEDSRRSSIRARELLERAGMADRRRAHPPELSGGEQQRVAVCAAIAKRPRLLLADEPTGELDPEASAQVSKLLLELVEEVGATALVVTHDTELAKQTHRTIHIRDGRLSGEGVGRPVLVVDDQGWLRLPRRLREEAGV